MWVVTESVYLVHSDTTEVFSCWGPYESFREAQGVADEMRMDDRASQRDEASYDVVELTKF
jgi:hypothetical protein